MRKRLLLAAGFLLLCACHNSDVQFKVLIGATAILSPDSKPIDDSVIVIAGSKIRAVGMRKYVPIPQNSDRTDLTGRWVVPAQGSVIGAEETANLLILDHAPNGIAPARPEDVGARLVAGEWKTGH